MKTLRKMSSSASGLAHAGSARVVVKRGYNLMAADKGGKSDPYVVIQAPGGQKAKTSVKKGTVNPVWDETLVVGIADDAAPLYLEVWDHDKIGMNDSLGAGEILLGQCEPGTPTLLTIAVDKQGTVEVEVTWLPAESPAQEVAESSSMAAMHKDARSPPTGKTQSTSAAALSQMSREADGKGWTRMGMATVRVLRGANLRAADRGGKSDPYVVLQQAGGKKTKTSVKKGTVNPIWDETLELGVTDTTAPLLLEAWDHDVIGRNDSLGAGEILLSQCTPGVVTPLTIELSTPGLSKQGWVDGPSAKQGSIVVEVLWRPPQEKAPILSPVQLASREAAREAAAARQAAEAAAEAAAQAEREREEKRKAAEAAVAAAEVAAAAQRAALKEAEAKEAAAKEAAHREEYEKTAREREERRKAAGEQPPVGLQEYHRLIVHVEHCMAKRPSPMGSLQGASERCAHATRLHLADPYQTRHWLPPIDPCRYASSFKLLQDMVLGHPLVGECGDIVIVANNLGYRPPPPPGTEETTTARGELVFPRLGSFEVSLTLYDTHTGMRWGPTTLYSKMATYKVRHAARATCSRVGLVVTGVAQGLRAVCTCTGCTHKYARYAVRSFLHLSS